MCVCEPQAALAQDVSTYLAMLLLWTAAPSALARSRPPTAGAAQGHVELDAFPGDQGPGVARPDQAVSVNGRASGGVSSNKRSENVSPGWYWTPLLLLHVALVLIEVVVSMKHHGTSRLGLLELLATAILLFEVGHVVSTLPLHWRSWFKLLHWCGQRVHPTEPSRAHAQSGQSRQTKEREERLVGGGASSFPNYGATSQA